MVSFEFERRYGSLEDLRSHIEKARFVSMWQYKEEYVILNHIDDDDCAIFNIMDDGSVEFARIEELYAL